MRTLSAILAVSFFAGCASQPAQKQNDPQVAALVGIMLLASAAKEMPSGSAEVKIPSNVLKVIVAVQDARQSRGRWPTRKEVPLPDGVKEIVLTEGPSDVDLAIKSETAVLLRCRLALDGSLILPSPCENLLRLLDSLKLSPESPSPNQPPKPTSGLAPGRGSS